MPSDEVKDFSFKIDRVGKMILKSGGDYVKQIIMMLFAMVPGTDEQDPNRGLNLPAKKFQTFTNQTRDVAYESEITRQLSVYTDIRPVNVIAVYLSETFLVHLEVIHNGETYVMNLSPNLDADLDSLTSMLINISGFNTL